VIAFNGGAGVAVQDATSTGNAIRGNLIHANAGVGTDLGGDGVTPNDVDDFDTGPNNLQNFPFLTSATFGATTSVTGELTSTPNTSFSLDFYANDTADPSAHSDGQVYLGSTVVVTDSTGQVFFSVTVAAPGSPSQTIITATATDPAGNTSEFGSINTTPALSI